MPPRDPTPPPDPFVTEARWAVAMIAAAVLILWAAGAIVQHWRG